LLPGVAAATARLRRRIKFFLASGGMRFFVGLVKLLALLCISGGRVFDSGGSPVRFGSLPVCGGEGNWCIPVGVRFVRVAEFLGGVGFFFRSLVVWPAVADLVFLFQLVKVMADSLSAESSCLVVYQAVDLAAFPRFGVPWHVGRWRLLVVKLTNGMPEKLRKMNNSHRGSFIIFLFFEVLFVKGGCTVLRFNISSLSQKK